MPRFPKLWTDSDAELDANNWGQILKDYVQVSLSTNGAISSSTNLASTIQFPNGTTYTVGSYFNPPTEGSLNHYGLGIKITGGTTGSITRAGLGIQAQSGGGASATDQVEAANLVVQQNSADAAVTMVGIELNVNNNKTDDSNALTGALHYAYSANSDGSKIAGIAYAVSGAAQWRRGIRMDASSIATSGYVLDYGGDGTNGLFRIGANSRIYMGQTELEALGFNTLDQLRLGTGASDIVWGKALVSLGGGAAPTLGTIGGTGPTSAGQNSWMRALDSQGNAMWIPVWK